MTLQVGSWWGVGVWGLTPGSADLAATYLTFQTHFLICKMQMIKDLSCSQVKYEHIQLISSSSV